MDIGNLLKKITRKFADIANRLDGTDQAIDSVEEMLGIIDDRSVYSTSEKVIGKWVDGKTLYRRTYRIDVSRPGSSSFNLGISNFTVVNFYGAWEYPGIGFYPMIQVASNWELYVDNISSNGTLGVYVGQYRTGTYTLMLTIEYTKTTD